ncbi:LysR family transcriptional regulator [Roseibium algae]|uniref:LysR family transcriptional regulator n=1 Tax=Roseibium algae TaxID=3123038 RepID=A0ABU8TRM3_9HYPH
MMHTRQLFHFLTITETRSISEAARQLGITQPAISRSIKQLEETLYVKLFERRASGVVLTPEGRILARRVKLMSIEYQHALAEMVDLNQGIGGRLRIAAGPVWILEFLPSVIREFQEQFPNVRVSVISGGYAGQLEQLLSGELDAVCGTLDFPSHSEIIKETILKIRHTVIAREGHPLSELKRVSPRDLASYPWLVHVNHVQSTSRIGSYFSLHGLEPPKIAVETSTLGAVSFLRKTDFLTTYAEQGLETLKEMGIVGIEQEGTLWDFEAGIVCRRSSKSSPALRSFTAMVRAALQTNPTSQQL